MNRKAHILITDKDGNCVNVHGYAEACEHTKLANRTVLHLLRTGNKSRTGYTFDYDQSYTPHTCVPTKKFVIKHKVTGQIHTLVGWNTVCEFFNVTAPTIRLAVKRGYFRDYFFMEG